MAPELVSDPDHVSEKADVWSLGMVLWEMLALRTPFQHLSPQQIIAGARPTLGQRLCGCYQLHFLCAGLLRLISHRARCGAELVQNPIFLTVDC